MSVTPKQAFKLAFLNDCLDRGLTIDEIKAEARTLAVKTAALTDLITRPYNAAVDGLAGLGNTAKLVGGIGLLAGPPAIGAALGYGAAKMTDWDDTDTQEAKQRELIEHLRRYAAQARANAASRVRRDARVPSFSRI